MSLSFLRDIGVEVVNGGGIESESQLFVLIFICGVHLLLCTCGR